MSNIRTSLPFSTEPWEAAKDKFLEALTPEEIQSFDNATPENLFYEASALQKKHAHESRMWKMQGKMIPLIEGVKDYGRVIDVYSNTYGLILSPIWGSIRIILHIAYEAGKFQEKIVDMLARIGDALPQFRIYGTLFANHEPLLVALSSAYLDVLSFCIKAKELFLQGGKSSIPASIICKGVWKPFRQDFDDYMVLFRKHQKSVEKKAVAAHMIESAKTREIELANQRVRHRDKIFAALPTVDYQAKHDEISGQRHPGTCEWIQNQQDYKSWLGEPGSACLCTCGILGSGKSVLTAKIVEDLTSEADEQTIVCFYYCDYSDPMSLEPTRFVASLIKQILLRFPLESFGEGSFHIFGDNKKRPSYTKSVEYLIQLTKMFEKVVLVMDGLNELAHSSQLEVLKLIDNLLDFTKPVVKVFITSRSEEYSIRVRLKQYMTINVSGELIEDDISLFVKETLRSKIISKNPRLLNPALRKEIQDALVKGAKDMFLWVKFQLDDVCEALTENDIRTTLRKLPRGLGETYVRILTKVYNSPGGELKIETAKRAFRWVVCARRTLQLEELEEAVGLQKSDKFLHRDRTASQSRDGLISACGSLVVYNRADGTVALAHHTVQQFLCTREAHQIQGAYPESVHFGLADADLEIGEICLTYLSFPEFNTEPTQAPENCVLSWPSALLKYARSNVFWYHGFKGAAESSLPSRTTYTFPEVAKASARLQSKYLMLEYVIDFWAFHTSRITPKSDRWADFRCITFSKQLVFEFRPWKNKEIHERFDRIFWEDEVYVYSWALENGIQSFLGLLISENSIDQHLAAYLKTRYLSNNVTDLYRWFVDRVFCLPATELLQENFWCGQLVYNTAQEYDEGHKPIYKPIPTLEFLRDELRFHSSRPGASQLNSIFEQGRSLALLSEDSRTFRNLSKYFEEPSYDQFSRVLISVAKEGCNRWYAMAIALCQSPHGVPSPSLQVDLVFALNFYLPSIADAYRSGDLNLSMVGRYYATIVLALAILSLDNYIELICGLISVEGVYVDRVLKMGSTPWQDTVLGTEDSYKNLQLLYRKTPVAIAFEKLRPVLQRKLSSKQGYQKVFAMLINHPDFTMDSVILLERADIHCLSWSAWWDLPDVVSSLMPFYDTDEISTRAKNEAFLNALKYSEKSIDLLLKWDWPESFLRLAVNAPEFLGVTKRYRLKVLDVFRKTMERKLVQNE